MPDASGQQDQFREPIFTIEEAEQRGISFWVFVIIVPVFLLVVVAGIAIALRPGYVEI